MSKAHRHDHRPKANEPDLPAKRTHIWLRRAMLALIVAGIALGVWAMNRSSSGAGVAPTPAAPPSSSASPAEVRQRLVGRWRRPDGGYVLSIKSIAEDGKVDAAYNNPRPINVGKASVTDEGGRTLLHVELRDRLYPGSYYTLTYDQAQDRLVGDYHHLGINQTFDVIFERLPKEAGGKE